jgi:hypothetical protein
MLEGSHTLRLTLPAVNRAVVEGAANTVPGNCCFHSIY